MKAPLGWNAVTDPEAGSLVLLKVSVPPPGSVAVRVACRGAFSIVEKVVVPSAGLGELPPPPQPFRSPTATRMVTSHLPTDTTSALPLADTLKPAYCHTNAAPTQ